MELSNKFIIIIILIILLYFYLLDFFSKNPVRQFFEKNLGSMLTKNTTHFLIVAIESNTNMASGFILLILSRLQQLHFLCILI